MQKYKEVSLEYGIFDTVIIITDSAAMFYYWPRAMYSKYFFHLFYQLCIKSCICLVEKQGKADSNSRQFKDGCQHSRVYGGCVLSMQQFSRLFTEEFCGLVLYFQIFHDVLWVHHQVQASIGGRGSPQICLLYFFFFSSDLAGDLLKCCLFMSQSLSSSAAKLDFLYCYEVPPPHTHPSVYAQ